MTYQDQRNDEHPEAVRSDPVPVQRSASDDEFDTDRDGVDDRTDADRGFHENTVPEAGYHENVTEDGQQDDVVDADRDGADDRVDDEAVEGRTDDEVVEGRADDEVVEGRADEVRDDTDVYHEAEDERTGYDEPVIASPVDTDVERAGVDRAELDQDRTEDDRDLDGPTFPDSALTPVAFGAATAGGAAAAAAMAGNRTDTRTDAEALDDRVEDVDDRVDEPVVEDHDEPTELMPGAVEAAPVTALVAVEAAQGFRDRWREVQLRFVDDPRGAAAEAQGLAEEVSAALVAALDSMRNDLGGWEASEGTDTEHLRVVVRRYRDFLDRMLQS